MTITIINIWLSICKNLWIFSHWLILLAVINVRSIQTHQKCPSIENPDLAIALLNFSSFVNMLFKEAIRSKIDIMQVMPMSFKEELTWRIRDMLYNKSWNGSFLFFASYLIFPILLLIHSPCPLRPLLLWWPTNTCI